VVKWILILRQPGAGLSKDLAFDFAWVSPDWGLALPNGKFQPAFCTAGR
jgi:hypothetical protein